MIRKLVTALLFTGVTGVFVAPAFAQGDAWPSQPIKIIVPFPPGGPADALARIAGDKLAAAVGKPVVVENRTGAGGNIGLNQVAKSAADGYTFGLAPAGNLTVNPSLYRNVPYDVAKDFAPVTLIGTVPNILVLHPSVPAHSVAQLIQYAKSHPGALNFGSPGPGSGAHLAGELFNAMAGVKVAHIPFNGQAPAVAAIVGGQIQLMFAGAPAVLQHVKAGKLIALGVASPERVASMPELPTIAESGLTGFEVVSWYGLVAPAGTKPEIVQRVQQAIAAALIQPDVKEKFAGLGVEPVGNTPAEFAKTIQAETGKWAKIVAEAGIRVE